MICQACSHESPPGNAFCGACGAALAAMCGRCGEPNPPDNAFCGKCGQRVAPEPDAETTVSEPETGERRQLTVLFCDLVGSTDLAARLDPEEYREALRAYHTHADAVITRYGGYVAQHLGDGLLVYFGWPQTYDDAAERAVRAGLGLVEVTATVQAGGAALAARVGLHTGAVVVSDVGAGRHHETLAVGDTPNVAARVQGVAEPSQVLITAATHRLVAGLFIVEDRGAQPLKGVPQPVELYRVVQPSGVRGRLGAAAARGFTPFVNRTEERNLLRSRFERVCEGDGQVVLITGEAGIGKSRLAQVLREELVDTPHTWLETGGAPHFANTPFHAVIELLRERRPWDDDSPAARAEGVAASLRLAGVDPTETLPLLAPLLDVPLPDGYPAVVATPEIARKHLLATLAAWVLGTARLQPLVILIEDLHWVDPSSLDLLQLLGVQGATAPLLLLCTARAEFQVPWPMRAHHTRLTLNHLAKRHVRDMVLGVAAQTNLLAEVVDEVAARTDGVPLFVEELTKAVVEVGAVAAARSIPATLADSLMARLDRLGPQAKEVAQVAAVCGRQFSFELVHAVHPIGDAELEAALRTLADAELVHASGMAPQATYTFKHGLVQDAAYESLLKSRRRALHAQVAETLAKQFPAAAEEHPELLAHHHAAAMQADLAIAAWQRAGERALDRGAVREAQHYLERGLTHLTDVSDPQRRDWYEFQLQLNLANARLVAQGLATAGTSEALMRAMQLGERVAEPVPLAGLLLGRFASELAKNGPLVARPLSEQCLIVARRTGERTLEALARFTVGLIDFHTARLATARATFVAAIDLTGDDAVPVPLPMDFGIFMRTFLAEATWMVGFPDQARAASRDAYERALRSPRVADRAWTAHRCAVLSVFLRDPQESAVYARQALDASAVEPNPTGAAMARVVNGWCLAQRGDVAAGRDIVQDGIDAMVATGQRLGLELCHCLLADTHALAGDLDGALKALAEGETTCPDQTVHRPETLLRRADLIAQRGAPTADVEAAFAAALECARLEGAKSYELRIATRYSRWLRQQDRSTEARDLLAPLYASFTEGFDTCDLRDARQLLAALNSQGDGADSVGSVEARAEGVR